MRSRAIFRESVPVRPSPAPISLSAIQEPVRPNGGGSFAADESVPGRRVLPADRPSRRVVIRCGLAPEMNPRDLRALESDSGHQALLPEDEGVDPLLEGRCRQVLGEALVYNHDVGADAE